MYYWFLAFVSLATAPIGLLLAHWLWKKIFPPQDILPAPLADDRDSISLFYKITRGE